MQITIKQAELETAVENYVRAMGIQVPVESITFTASRSENQTITEIVLSVSGLEGQGQVAPTLEVVPTSAASTPVETASDAPLEEEDDPVVVEDDDEDALPPGTSLFGS